MEPGDLVITITRRANGQLELAGPIQDAILMHGLLALAGDAVRDWHKAQQNRIVAPPPGLRLVPS